MATFGDDTATNLEDDARIALQGIEDKPDWQTAIRGLREVVIDLARVLDMYEQRIQSIERRIEKGP